MNLIVLQSDDVWQLGEFYGALGLHFITERHGDGPEHLTCDLGQMTLEIYPGAGQSCTAGMRLGFGVSEVSASFARAMSRGGIAISDPRPGPWGKRAVVQDPAGHIVELTELNPTSCAHSPGRQLVLA